MRRATARRITAAACAVAAAWLLESCAGNGAGLDANGQPLVPGAPGDGPLTADFASIQAQVFTPICTACHAGADAPHGLRLDAANSYNLLVGVHSAEVPALLRVKPGDPDASYLIEKLEGLAAVGARMPFGGPYLAGSTIAVIRQWITDGAQPARSAVAEPFAMVSVAPAAGEVLGEAPPQIMIGFNRELDVTRIDPDSVRIERRAGQDMEAPAQRVAARAEVPSANPRALLLWPLQPLGAGHYRVLMRLGAAGMTDIAGELLPAADPADALILAFDIEAGP